MCLSCLTLKPLRLKAHLISTKAKQNTAHRSKQSVTLNSMCHITTVLGVYNHSYRRYDVGTYALGREAWVTDGKNGGVDHAPISMHTYRFVVPDEQSTA